MSVRATTAAWYGSQARGTTKLVLLAIADCANDEGGNAYPSMATIARKCGLQDERSAQRHVRKLEELGELTVEAGRGRRGSNLYHVRVDLLDQNSKKTDQPHPGKSATPANLPPPADSPDDPRQIDRGDPGISAAPTPANLPPKPSLNRKETGERTETPSPEPSGLGLRSEAEAIRLVPGSLPELSRNLATCFPAAPEGMDRGDEAALLAAQSILAELSGEDWAALQAWFGETDDDDRGCKLWPRTRSEFLWNAGEAVEKIRRWWGGPLGRRFRARRGRRSRLEARRNESQKSGPSEPSADFVAFAEATGKDPADIAAAWREDRWNGEFAAWLMAECDSDGSILCRRNA